jgi:DNA ligase (NAD+)
VATRLVRSPADLFALSDEDLREVAGMPPRSAANLLRAIARARGPRLVKVITALGIPGVGARTARVLAEECGSLTVLRRASVDRLSALPGVGPAAAREIVGFLRGVHGRTLISRLTAVGAVSETGEPTEGAHSARRPIDRAAAIL